MYAVEVSESSKSTTYLCKANALHERSMFIFAHPPSSRFSRQRSSSMLRGVDGTCPLGEEPPRCRTMEERKFVTTRVGGLERRVLGDRRTMCIDFSPTAWVGAGRLDALAVRGMHQLAPDIGHVNGKGGTCSQAELTHLNVPKHLSAHAGGISSP